MRWLRSAAWLVLYTALAYLLLMPLMADAGRRLPDDGDSVLGLWIVWWGATHLSEGYPGLLDANAYYPHSQGLVFSEPMLSQALLSWPLFRTMDNPILAANLLTLITLALSAAAAHWFLRELAGSDAAAAVGAVYYAFGCFNLSQIPRVQLISLQWLPLALLCLHRFFDRDRRPYLAGFVVFSILHGLACFYYLAFYAVILAILVPAYFFACRFWEKRVSMAFLLLSGTLMGAVFSFVVHPYVSLYRHYGFTGSPSGLDIGRFFQPPSGGWLYGLWAFPPHLVDYFLGFLALAFAGFGLAVSVRSGSLTRFVALAYFAVGLLGFLLSGGPDLIFNGSHLGPGPYRLLQATGPFANLRDPDRFAVLARLAVAILAALGAAAILARLRPSRRVWVGVALALVLLAEQWSSRYTRGTEIPSGDTVPEAYRWLSQHPGSEPLAELPVLPFRFVRFNTMEAYFSTFHRRKILFNKPSFYPPAMEILRWELRNFPDPTSVTLLQALGVRTAVVHPKRWGRPRRRERYLQALERRKADLPLLRRFSDRNDPLWDRYNLGGEQIHLVIPPDEMGVPRACECSEVDRQAYRLESSNSTDPTLATDGDRATRWTTGDAQQKGDYLSIRFDRPRRVARVEIEMAFPWEEFPRHLEMNGIAHQRVTRIRRIADPWYTLALIRQLVEDPSKARLRYDLEPMTVERLHLFIDRTEEGSHPWSVAEIHVFEAPQ